MKNRKWTKNEIGVLLVVVFFSFYSMYNVASKMQTDIEEISYNEFNELVNQGEVDTVVYSTSSEYMTVRLYNEESRNLTDEEKESYVYPPESIKRVLYPAYDDFRKDLLEKDVKLIVDKQPSFLEFFLNLTPLLMMGFWIFLIFRTMRSQMKGIDKKAIAATSDVKFDNVIGQDEILEDIQFITRLIKDPGLGDDLGAKVPKGLLLVGPPGTGKTLIAKAIAGEAGVSFLSISGSDFKELFVGMGARRVRELFEEARKNKPCVVFIDEIDSVGAKRDSRGSSSEDDQTINALLKEMDGFTGREGIFVIAATNRVDKLDSALIRSGRFDRQIYVNPPRDWRVRFDLFKYYLKDVKLGDDVDIESLSKQVTGFTGADIAMICNEASIIAVMHNKAFVDRECFEEAIDKKVFHGNRSKAKAHDHDKNVVAYHEAGHAVMSWLCGHGIARASILASTSGVGGAVFGVESDIMLRTKEYIEERVLICYAGRASEAIKFSKVTTGASNDITQATQLLEEYVTQFGFSREFGLIDITSLRETSGVLTSNVLDTIKRLSNNLYDKCESLLKENYDLVEALASKLLEVETIDGADIEVMFKEMKNCS